MDIRVLQYFLAVAQEESITKAAKSLHMTQPPLSRQLKDLEEELGKQLLIRGSKKVTLTEDGILLRRRAEEIIELTEKTKQELMSSDYDIQGDISIGGGESEAVSFLAQIAYDLQQEYPQIHYHMYSGDAERVMEKLEKGLIDFGLFVAAPTELEKYNYIRLPIQDTWGVLMRSDCSLAKKEGIVAEDLWDKPLIVSHQVSKSSELFQWLGKSESQLNIVMKYDLIYNASHFAKKGFGYVLGLDGIINTTGDSKLCFRPLSPVWKTDLFLVWKKYQVLSGASNVYLKRIRQMLN